ncbi:hypothetical protein D3C80_1215420 [compost metagenome]
MLGVEYFEIIPSVNAITAKSSGTFNPILLAVLIIVTAKSSFTAKTASKARACRSSEMVISQVSTSSIFMIKSSLKGNPLSNKAFS